jgi:hypothetical protein
MNSAILIAIFSFNHGVIDVNYPMGIAPWVLSAKHVQPGKISAIFKEKVLVSPKCTWSSVNTDSKAVSSITYYPDSKIDISVFEKHGKKNLNKDVPFILSCKEN